MRFVSFPYFHPRKFLFIVYSHTRQRPVPFVKYSNKSTKPLRLVKLTLNVRMATFKVPQRFKTFPIVKMVINVEMPKEKICAVIICLILLTHVS